MNETILHHVPFSRSFRILWALRELGLDFDLKTWSIRDGSLQTPAFKAISPSGRVPALEIDGTVIYESQAILEYLWDTHSSHAFWPKGDAFHRAKAREWFGFAETQGGILTTLNVQHLFLRPPAKPSAAVLKMETARLAASLKMLDRHLGEHDFLMGNDFSVCDVMFSWNLLAAPYYVAFDGFSNLNAYLGRWQARDAYQTARAEDGEQEFYTKSFYEIKE